MSISVRKSIVEDASTLIQVINWAYRGKEGVTGWTGEGHLIAGVRMIESDLVELIKGQNDNLVVFVAVDSETNEIRGCIKVERVQDEGTPPPAEFGLYAVDPSYQGKGVGSKLYRHAVSWVKQEWGSKHGHMWVITARSDIWAHYAHLGYSDTGKRINFSDLTGAVGDVRPETVEKYGPLQLGLITAEL